VQQRASTAYEMELQDYYHQLDKQRKRNARGAMYDQFSGLAAPTRDPLVGDKPLPPGTSAGTSGAGAASTTSPTAISTGALNMNSATGYRQADRGALESIAGSNPPAPASGGSSAYGSTGVLTSAGQPGPWRTGYQANVTDLGYGSIPNYAGGTTTISGAGSNPAPASSGSSAYGSTGVLASAGQPGPWSTGYQANVTDLGYGSIPNYAGGTTTISGAGSNPAPGLTMSGALRELVSGYLIPGYGVIKLGRAVASAIKDHKAKNPKPTKDTTPGQSGATRDTMVSRLAAPGLQRHITHRDKDDAPSKGVEPGALGFGLGEFPRIFPKAPEAR